MSSRRVLLVAVSTALLSGCAITAKRGECEFMLPTERERCLQANKSNEEALKTRAESKRKAQPTFVMPAKKHEGDQ